MEALAYSEALVCLLGLRGHVASVQPGLGEPGLVLPSFPDSQREHAGSRATAAGTA